MSTRILPASRPRMHPGLSKMSQGLYPSSCSHPGATFPCNGLTMASRIGQDLPRALHNFPTIGPDSLRDLHDAPREPHSATSPKTPSKRQELHRRRGKCPTMAPRTGQDLPHGFARFPEVIAEQCPQEFDSISQGQQALPQAIIQECIQDCPGFHKALHELPRPSPNNAPGIGQVPPKTLRCPQEIT